MQSQAFSTWVCKGRGKSPLPLHPIPKTNNNSKSNNKTKTENKIKVVYTEDFCPACSSIAVTVGTSCCLSLVAWVTFCPTIHWKSGSTAICVL